MIFALCIWVAFNLFLFAWLLWRARFRCRLCGGTGAVFSRFRHAYVACPACNHPDVRP